MEGTVKGLSDSVKNGLALTFASMMASGNTKTVTIKIGAICSGSELYLSSVQHFSSALKSHLGISSAAGSIVGALSGTVSKGHGFGRTGRPRTASGTSPQFPTRASRMTT